MIQDRPTQAKRTFHDPKMESFFVLFLRLCLLCLCLSLSFLLLFLLPLSLPISLSSSLISTQSLSLTLSLYLPFCLQFAFPPTFSFAFVFAFLVVLIFEFDSVFVMTLPRLCLAPNLQLCHRPTTAALEVGVKEGLTHPTNGILSLWHQASSGVSLSIPSRFHNQDSTPHNQDSTTPSDWINTYFST